MRLFDLHCDTVYMAHQSGQSLDKNNLHIDLEHGLRYDPWSQVFAVWIPDEWRGEEACEKCDGILDFAHQQADLFADRMALVRNGAEMNAALSGHKCAAWLAVEGGAALGGKLERVQHLYDRGVRLMTITWNGSNELANGCFSPCEEGLTPFGKAALQEMERVGILPDVSHLNRRGFEDLMACTTGPVIATHSLSATVHDHPRNLTDAQFTALCERGGLVGLNLCAEHLGEQTFEQFERHLEHDLALGGEACLALGCDLDGMDFPPEWHGIDAMEQLGDYLIRKNYQKTIIDRLFFDNAYQFFNSL